MSPANSHVLILAAAGLAFVGRAEEGAGLADRALRLDPRMTPANLVGVKDAYFMARRYQDTVATVTRMPEEQRTRDSWVFLAASYAYLGKERVSLPRRRGRVAKVDLFQPGEDRCPGRDAGSRASSKPKP
jgi:hypothetical protein